MMPQMLHSLNLVAETDVM